MNRLSLLLAALAISLAAPAAHAFCGFYVAGGDQKMFNDATQVVLMRMGTRTVLAMQNNYKGPPEAFAMVIPVPVVLHEADVKTLPKEVFAHVEQMGAPRLVDLLVEEGAGVARHGRRRFDRHGIGFGLAGLGRVLATVAGPARRLGRILRGVRPGPAEQVRERTFTHRCSFVTPSHSPGPPWPVPGSSLPRCSQNRT